MPPKSLGSLFCLGANINPIHSFINSCCAKNQGLPALALHLSQPSRWPALYGLLLLFTLHQPTLSLAAGISKSTESHVIVKGHLGQFGAGDYVQFKDQSGRITGTGKAYRATGRNAYFQVIRGTAPKGTTPHRTDSLNRVFGEGVYAPPRTLASEQEEPEPKRNTFSILLFGGLYTSERNFPNLLTTGNPETLNGITYGGDFRYGSSRYHGGLALRIGAKYGKTPAEDNPQEPNLEFLSYNGGVEYVIVVSKGARFGLGAKFEYVTYKTNEEPNTGLREDRRYATPFANFFFIFSKSIALGVEYQKPLSPINEFRATNEDIISLALEISF